MEIFELPVLIELSEFRGDFSAYLEAVYEIFKEDFVSSQPIFKGKRLGLKRHPLVDNKEYTFYHMTHEGNIEHERNPDLRRMERISWPRPLIDHSEHEYIKVWRNIRRGTGGTKSRILILHEQEKYLVVLDDRGNFILPWTAYPLGSKKLNKLLKEYNNYKKAEAAPS